MEQENTTQYKQHEIVWAKVQGYPWWPAIIAHLEENTPNPFLVNFIGHNSHSYMNKEKIRNYDEFYQEHSENKGIMLTKAIELANKIKQGELTYEEQKHLVALETHSKERKISNSIKPKKYLKNLKKLQKFKQTKRKFLRKQAEEPHKSDNTTQNFHEIALSLEEINSTNPFQRISRSMIKELHISTINQDYVPLRKKPQQKPKNAKTIKKNPEINSQKSLQPMKNEENDNNEGSFPLSQAKIYEQSLEECLFKLNIRKGHTELQNLSKLMSSYNDLSLSAEELFKSKIPKILKAIYTLIKQLKNAKTELIIIQLESILTHIKEKVLNELLNTQVYSEKIMISEPKHEENKSEYKTEPTINTPVMLDKSFSDISTTSTAPIKLTRSQKNKDKLVVKTKKIAKNEKINVQIAKPCLRKKICLKLAKIFQEKYSFEKIMSQKLALDIESKARNEFPLMNFDYKNHIKMVFYFLKNKRLNREEISNIFSQDFKTIVKNIKENEKTSFLESAEHSEMEILVKNYSCN